MRGHRGYNDSVGLVLGGVNADKQQQDADRKKQYAAELAAQMREQEQKKKMERMERLGIPTGNTGPRGGGSLQSTYESNSSPTGFGASPQQQQQQQLPPPGLAQQQQQSWQQPVDQNMQQQQSLGYGGPGMGAGGFAPGGMMPYGAWQPGAPYGGAVPMPMPGQYTTMSIGAGPGYNAPMGGYPSSTFPGPGGGMLAGSPLGMQQPYGAGLAAAGPSGAWGGLVSQLPAAAWGGGPAPGPLLGGPSGNWGGAGGGAAAAGGDTWGQYTMRQQQLQGSQFMGGRQSVGGGGGTEKKAGDQQRKDAYRAELEAQIREKADRKAAEKRRLQQEDERQAAQAAVDNPWGRAGGGGAPHRDPVTGQIITNLKGYRSDAAATAAAATAAAEAGWSQHQQSPPQQQQRWDQQGSSSPRPGLQSSSPTGWQQQTGGRMSIDAPAARASVAGAPPAPPMLRFRSDKAYMTSDEVEQRARQQRDLQDALAQQVAEKQRRKDEEKRRQAEEAAADEARMAREQAALRAAHEAEAEQKRAKQQQASSGGDAAESETTDGVTVMTKGRRARQQQQEAAGSPAQQQQQQQQQQNYVLPPAAAPPPGAPGNGWQLPPQSLAGADTTGLLSATAPAASLGPIYSAAQAAAEQWRADLTAQATAMREMLERQGGELTALRAAAAAAEAESLAAKQAAVTASHELLQIKNELLTRDPKKETLDTILADYGPPMVRNMGAYHPAPQRFIDIDLPASPSILRKSLQQQHQQGSGVAAVLGGGTSSSYLASGTFRGAGSSLNPGATAAAAERPPMQQPSWQEGPTEFTQFSSTLPAGGGLGASNSLAALGTSTNSLHQVDPTSTWGRAAGLTGTMNVRDSTALVCESTFVYPQGVAPKDAQQQQQQVVDPLASSSAAAWEELKEQKQQQGAGDALDWGLRSTGQAPGTLTSTTGDMGRATVDPRQGLTTPQQLAQISRRNADKLQLLSSIDCGRGKGGSGGAEALDSFLAKFVGCVPGMLGSNGGSNNSTLASGKGLGSQPAAGSSGGAARPAGAGVGDTLDRVLQDIRWGQMEVGAR